MTPQEKKIYGLIGLPVRHSLSPAMHNAAFAHLKIDAEYRLFELRPEELEDFLSSLSQNRIFGLNVTVPYKEAVLGHLQWLAPEAESIGAVNTIVVKDKDHLEGWNTDGIGFHRHLTDDLRYDPAGKRAAILGAGGAAKAVADQLARRKAKSITLYDADKERSSKLTDKLNREFPECKAHAAGSINGLGLKGQDLLINATPIGMKEADPCLIEKGMLHSGLLVYDLIYNPAETKLLALAKEAGARTANGLGMLLYQGALSFEHWTDKAAPIAIMKEALEEGVKKICSQK
ncbi:MAG: shikimate dehydrogenase [Candidatus Omnitrophica bacterium]|nr:shikimate dehydrogenase [Candidatus Omnitrophota bacterium]